MSTTGRDRSLRANPLTARGIRMRNACVQHAAAQLGLEVPGDAELRALADDASLWDAVEWWQGKTSVVAAVPVRRRRSLVLLRVVVGATVTVLGLALSYRPVS